MTSLFSKLEAAIPPLSDDLTNSSQGMRAKADNAKEVASHAMNGMHAFVYAFEDVTDSVESVEAWLRSARTFTDFTLQVRAAADAVKRQASARQLREVSATSTGTLGAYDDASSPPFGCKTSIPPECGSAPLRVPPMLAAANFLAFLVGSAGSMAAIPTNLLTGLGDTLCLFRGTAALMVRGLSKLVEPLEQQAAAD